MWLMILKRAKKANVVRFIRNSLSVIFSTTIFNIDIDAVSINMKDRISVTLLVE